MSGPRNYQCCSLKWVLLVPWNDYCWFPKMIMSGSLNWLTAEEGYIWDRDSFHVFARQYLICGLDDFEAIFFDRIFYTSKSQRPASSAGLLMMKILFAAYKIAQKCLALWKWSVFLAWIICRIELDLCSMLALLERIPGPQLDCFFY